MRSSTNPARRKIRFGFVHVDELTFQGAIEAIAERVDAGEGGYVVTPNVDHVCLAETNVSLREAYRDATLSLVDGMPLVWLARLMRTPLPAKISGSDLVRPLVKRAAEDGWRVYLLGGVDGVGEQAAKALRNDFPALNIVGIDSPALGFEQDPEANDAVLARIRAAAPHIVLVALGCPKQELWMHTNAAKLAPAVFLGIGATLDFLAGRVRRAPGWMSRTGLEWAYRLAQEPRRMASRYLVRDRAIFGVALRMLLAPRRKRIFFA